MFDRNPQTWVQNPFDGRARDFAAATQTVARSASQPSRVTLQVAN
jgi:hypothetical protein